MCQMPIADLSVSSNHLSRDVGNRNFDRILYYNIINNDNNNNVDNNNNDDNIPSSTARRQRSRNTICV